jgi:twitching motility protein PilT
MGPDRIIYILDNLEKLSHENRVALRDFVNKMLISMIERDASDIEIGGHGSGGFVWMRIFGKKERVKEFQILSADEATVIITNLLNSNQRRYLGAAKNLDFSYTFLYGRKNINVRFRADAYFDLDTLTLNMRAINSEIRSIDSYGFHPNVIKTLSHTYIRPYINNRDYRFR